MPFTIDAVGDGVLAWSLTDDGARARRLDGYAPTMAVAVGSAPDEDPRAVEGLDAVRGVLAARHDVREVRREEWRRGFRHGPEPVLRADVEGLDRVRPVARAAADLGAPGDVRPYDVDFTPAFRVCLERDLSPVPDRDLRVTSLSAPAEDLVDPPLSGVTVDRHLDERPGERIEGDPATVACAVDRRLGERNPDVLVVSSAEIVPALAETAAAGGVDCHLGRRPGYRRRAGESTYESYGQVHHSPARYAVPGRAIVDRSNTFLYDEAGLAGCLDVVERSGKPLQELAWASIGSVLTAIQIREARSRGVLVPWRSWRHELFKPAATLHAADRGGVTFAPDVGVHEGVHELDFSSLYPNVICTRNVSPETVRCDCHDTDDVPGLGYSICEKEGYLPEVLQPLVDDRDEIKTAIRETDDPERRATLEARSSAIKWILVSCFGYQGFSNAKFGRIECHEAINAFAREVLLDAKERLEAGGWRVVHGIVDSLWVTPRERDRREILAVADEITDDAGIRLEYEAEYDWIAFVPRREDRAGALTKYFGKRTDGSYKFRGIECRQRSTAPFVARCQRALVEAFDEHRAPEAVCDLLARQIARLRDGGVDPADLAIDRRAAKRLDEYTHYTRTVAALERAVDCGLDPRPGQTVSFVVVDDDRSDRDRVRLARESPDSYDPEFYAGRLVRAAESVLSPLGWDRERIERELQGGHTPALSSFGR